MTLHSNTRRGGLGIIGFRYRDAVFVGVSVKAGVDRLPPERTDFLDQPRASGGNAFAFWQSFERYGLPQRP